MITMGQAIAVIISMIGLAAITYVLGYCRGRREGVDDFYEGCMKELLEGEQWKK